MPMTPARGAAGPAPLQTAPTYTLYSPRRRWFMLAILFLVCTWNYVDRLAVAILLEPIKREFGASDTQMGILTGLAFAASYAVFGLPVARLSDRGDRRLVLTVALLVWGSLTACCGLASTFLQLAVARIGVGIGEAGAIPPAQSLIADYFPPEQRTRALAIFMSSAMIGMLIAFGVGATVAAAYGWRWAFIVLGVPGALIAVVAYLGLDEPRRRVAVTRGVAAENVRESVAALLRKRSFIVLNISMTCYFFVAYGAVSWFPAYLERVLHMGMREIGATYGPVTAIASFIGTLAGGLLAERMSLRDRRWLGWTPALLLLLALPVYELGLLTSSPTLFIVAAAIGAALLYGAVPAMFAILHAICGSPRRALAVAIVFFFANLLGLGLGPLITGALSDTLSRHYGPEGLGYALMLASGMLLPTALTIGWVGLGSLADQED